MFVVGCACICFTSNKHDAYGEDLLRIRVGWYVAKAHAGQAAEGKVERCDVDAADRGSVAGPVHAAYDVIGWLQALPKLVEPSCLEKRDGVIIAVWVTMTNMTMKPNDVWLQ